MRNILNLKIPLISFALIRFCAGGLLILLGACSINPPIDNIGFLPTPGIDVGDEIVLLDEATEKVVAHMTSDGRVNLVAITAKGDAYHIEVSENGIEHREKLGGSHRYGYYNNLALAEDGLGRLHMAIKNEHWLLDSGVWNLIGINPCSLMVRSGASVACSVDVSGRELGTAAQWGITGFGGYPGGGIFFPYRNRPSKLVLGSFDEGGWSYRSVIDHRLPYFVNLETYDGGILASDAYDRVYMLYRAHEGSNVHVRYATLPLVGDSAPTVEWRRPTEQTVKLTDFESVPVILPLNWFIAFGDLTFAVDPLTRKGVFFARLSTGFSRWIDGVVEVREGIFSQPVKVPFLNSRPKKLAPAGQDRYHALVALDHKLLYLAYHEGGWSGPTRIGEFGTPSLFLIGDSSIQLASDGRSRALAIWSKKEGALVGRWITIDDVPR